MVPPEIKIDDGVILVEPWRFILVPETEVYRHLRSYAPLVLNKGAQVEVAEVGHRRPDEGFGLNLVAEQKVGYRGSGAVAVRGERILSETAVKVETASRASR